MNHNYGGGNPMRPHRARLTMELVKGYGLVNKMEIMRMVPRTREEIMLFHADGGCWLLWGACGWWVLLGGGCG